MEKFQAFVSTSPSPPSNASACVVYFSCSSRQCLLMRRIWESAPDTIESKVIIARLDEFPLNGVKDWLWRPLEEVQNNLKVTTGGRRSCFCGLQFLSLLGIAFWAQRSLFTWWGRRVGVDVGYLGHNWTLWQEGVILGKKSCWVFQNYAKDQ